MDGPTHRYMISSPGCWHVYGQVLAREYSNRKCWKNHRLTVDAYAAQHPGDKSIQSIQSVAVHLLSLYWIFEEKVPHGEATRLIKRATALKFEWLTPPRCLGAINVKSVWETKGFEAHNSAVEKWANSVWLAWRSHHVIIKEWAKLVKSNSI